MEKMTADFRAIFGAMTLACLCFVLRRHRLAQGYATERILFR